MNKYNYGKVCAAKSTFLPRLFIEKISCCGKSGQEYTFEVYSDKTEFNSVPGVYIFCQKNIIGGGYDPLYVGQTDSFEQRLNTGIASHKHYDEAINLGMTHIAVMVISVFGFIVMEKDKENRINIEKDLILGLNPPLNSKS